MWIAAFSPEQVTAAPSRLSSRCRPVARSRALSCSAAATRSSTVSVAGSVDEIVGRRNVGEGQTNATLPHRQAVEGVPVELPLG